MSNGRLAVPAVVATAFAILFFGLGSFLGARPSTEASEIAALRAEIDQLRKRSQRTRPARPASARPSSTSRSRPARRIVEDVKRQLQSEMGLLPINMIHPSACLIEMTWLYSYLCVPRSILTKTAHREVSIFRTHKLGRESRYLRRSFAFP